MEFLKVTLEIMRSKAIFVLIFSFLLVAAPEAGARTYSESAHGIVSEAPQSAPEISYKVSMSNPSTHLIEMEMTVRSENLPKLTELKMAVWTPGSYLVREYARHVQDFSVVSGSKKLTWQKINKNTWQIDTGGAKSLTVRYNVYANDLTVRTNELNDQHLFFTPAALMMYPKGQLSAPSTVEIDPYGNWRVGTGLPAVSGKQNTYRAPNYDILFDSPFEVSDFTEKTFTVEGKKHRFVMSGPGNYDLDRIAADTTKIIEQAYKIFGELPYDDYTFIVNMRGGGGLEHLNSTALQWMRFGFQDPYYARFLGLIAHEYFHLFNVKRIRPDALGPFDYENENYTKLLWVAEGGTSYFDPLIRMRAGLINDKSLLSGEASIIESLYGQPGRFQTSLEEASFDAWIKYYRTDENQVNNQISYYDKGEVVNFLLDIMIRSESKGEKSLDDVMRHLYNEHFKKGRNYTPADYQKTAEMMAGKSLDDFFAKYVRGREEVDYDSILGRIGLKLVASRPESDKGYLGANFSRSGGLTIGSIPKGTPAWDAGLNADDEIIAIDGYKASKQFFDAYLAQKKEGDKLKISVFRHEELRQFDVTLGRTPAGGYAIRPVDDPTEEQSKLYQGLFGTALK